MKPKATTKIVHIDTWMHVTTHYLFSQKLSEDEEKQTLRCVMCTNPIRGFRDTLSSKEFSISGLCQECQDVCFDSTY